MSVEGSTVERESGVGVNEREERRGKGGKVGKGILLT